MSSSLRISAAITTSIALTSLLIYHRSAISSYGIIGICRYIWIGDHLPPSIRVSIDCLDEISKELTKCEAHLDRIEIIVQRALLESVDGPVGNADHSDASGINPHSKEEIKNQIFQQNPDLRKDIGFLSSRLDRLAARVDSVLSHSDDEVKKRKKHSSTRVVELMDALDKLVATLMK